MTVRLLHTLQEQYSKAWTLPLHCNHCDNIMHLLFRFKVPKNNLQDPNEGGKKRKKEKIKCCN